MSDSGQKLRNAIRTVAKTDTKTVVSYTLVARGRRGDVTTNSITAGSAGKVDASYAFISSTATAPTS
ncbi:hypothetical protein CJ014_00860 [Pleomorphomonas carboxyditropha]|uniref:Uncharacterized protein n=1 Tax=Pleomorphomonas carboxyditropha TaxID=2023338 RepID=A0A2G9X146_9HYPH|nr:hypothetical protein CJ014_00860 [Pleomorphomonas carboxyditropha]